MLYQSLRRRAVDRENPMDILVTHLYPAPKPLREVKLGLKLPKADGPGDALHREGAEARYPDVQTLLYVSVDWCLLECGPAFARRLPTPPPRACASRVYRRFDSKPRTRCRGHRAAAPGLLPVMIIAVAAAIAALIALAAALGTRPAPAPSLPPAAAAPAQPAQPTAAAQPAAPAAETPPDMVFSEEAVAAADAAPTLKLRVTSDPPGATIFLRMERMGTTPTTIDWRSPYAKRGKDVVVVLRLDGYAPYTMRRTIEGDQLDLNAVLERLPTEPAAEEPAAEPPVELKAPPEPPVMDVRSAVPQADVIDLPEDQLGQP